MILENDALKTILYIIRGLPGSGKSTLAKVLAPETNFSADDYHVVNGLYCYDKSRVKECHELCQQGVFAAIEYGHETVAVANTFSRRWEYQSYLDWIEEYNKEREIHHVATHILTCENSFGNTHEVSACVVGRMRSRWEYPQEVS